MNEKNIPPVPGTVTSLQRTALDKLERESVAASKKVADLREELKSRELAILEAGGAYLSAIEAGNNKAANSALASKGAAEISRDIARTGLRKSEEASGEAHMAFLAKRLELASVETSWTKVRSRVDPLVARFVKARGELVSVVLELEALTKELLAEQETAQSLRNTLKITAIRAPEITRGKVLALVVAGASLATRKAGTLGDQELAPWLRVAYDVALGSYVQRQFGLGLISESPEGIEKAKELIQNGELPRKERVASAHPAA